MAERRSFMLNMDAQVKQALTLLARDDRRSLGDEVQWLIEQEAARRGYAGLDISEMLEAPVGALPQAEAAWPL